MVTSSKPKYSKVLTTVSGSVVARCHNVLLLPLVLVDIGICKTLYLVNACNNNYHGMAGQPLMLRSKKGKFILMF